MFRLAVKVPLMRSLLLVRAHIQPLREAIKNGLKSSPSPKSRLIAAKTA
jgi:hypothetical protein